MYQWKNWLRNHKVAAFIIAVVGGIIMYKIFGPRTPRGLMFM